MSVVLDRKIEEIQDIIGSKVRLESVILKVKSLENVEIGNDYYILNTKPELLSKNTVFVSLISDTNKICFNQDRLSKLKDYQYQTFTGHLEVRVGTTAYNTDYLGDIEIEFLRIQPIVKRK